ncbi:MAG: YbaY family lipoprotein, partial [Rhodanobacteraceae bacterium]
MRKLVVAPLSIAVAALLLAGCGKSSNSGSSAATTSSESSAAASGAPAPSATAVTGTVTIQNQGIQLTPEAKLELSLVDVTTQPGVTVNKQDFNPPKFPQAFHIPFSASAINPNDLYVLQATMQDNGRTWNT